MTVALVVPHPAAMPGFNDDEVNSITSEYSYPSSTMTSTTSGLFSFSQTEPSGDLLSGSSWVPTAEGPQNFQDFSDNGSAHSGEAEDYIFTSGQTTPKGTRLDRIQAQGPREIQNTWNISQTGAVVQGGHAMSRVSSSRSSGSIMSRTSQLSNLDVTGNMSAFRTGSPVATASLAGIDSCLLLDPEQDTMSQVYWPTYLDTGLNADSSAFSLTDNTSLHIVPAQMQLGHDASIPDNSPPGSWDDFSSSISRTSSPATIEDLWLANQSPNSSPEISCQSPNLDRKIPMIPEDLNGNIIPQLDDGLVHSPTFTPRRQGSDGESARDHELYKKAATKDDGLYHCPWEGQASCNHKPEKLKCNYDKFVDSHLKPYRCKAEACEGARFSSTACLLRHEREAHGLHGHGDKPFLCAYEGCDRSVPGNGFPRQWNLRDHMKRVHSDLGSSGGSPTSAAPQPVKSRKRKTDVSESQASNTRKANVKSMPASSEAQDSGRSLLDQWMDHRKAMEDFMTRLGQPEDAHTSQQIKDMQSRLGDMLKVANEVKASKTDSMAINITFAGTG